MRISRATAMGSLAIALASISGGAGPAHAVCTMYMPGSAAGTTRSCSDYAYGYYIVVVNGSVSFTVTCNGQDYDSGTVTLLTPRVGGAPSGGCSMVVRITAQASATTAVAYID